METIDLNFVEMALQRVEGTPFEKFTQSVFASLAGVEFIPLGGRHDGGADGFVDASVFEGGTPSHFWQATVQEDHRAKIRATVKRLREVGRAPKQLTYCTARIVQNIDREEDLLTEELGVRVKIRDQKFIMSHINDSPQIVQAFRSYLAPALEALRNISASKRFRLT